MDLCSNTHQEICYEGRKCPACEVVLERDKALELVQQLREEVAGLSQELRDLGA